MRVALIHLPYAPPLMPSPALSYLGNYLLDKGHQVELIDINADLYLSRQEDWKKIGQFATNIQRDNKFKLSILQYLKGSMAYIRSKNFTHIGLACYDSTYSFLVPFLTLIKELLPEPIIIVGGPDTVENIDRYRHLLQEKLCNYVILKEGELKIQGILDGQDPLPQGILTQENQQEYRDIYIDKTMINLKTDHTRLKQLWNYKQLYAHAQLIPIYTSRGCPGKCTYCGHKIVWDGYRTKSVEQVIKDMKFYQKKWKPYGLYFTDMLLNGDAKWFRTFVETLSAQEQVPKWSGYMRVHPVFTHEFCKDLVKAGCSYAFFGVESASQKVLNRVCKGTRVKDNESVIPAASKAGLFLHVSCIVGKPYESVMEMIGTMDYVIRHHWEMDHVEIYFFENYRQSTGYEDALEYIEKQAKYDHYQQKKELYDRYIVPFNNAGSGLLNLQILYHPQSEYFKKALNQYFIQRLNNMKFEEAIKHVLESYPEIGQYQSFVDSLEQWYIKKGEQLSLLQELIIELQKLQ